MVCGSGVVDREAAMRVWSPMPIDGRQAGRQVCQIRPVKGNRSEGGDGRRMKAEWINGARSKWIAS